MSKTNDFLLPTDSAKQAMEKRRSIQREPPIRHKRKAGEALDEDLEQHPRNPTGTPVKDALVRSSPSRLAPKEGICHGVLSPMKYRRFSSPPKQTCRISRDVRARVFVKHLELTVPWFPEHYTTSEDEEESGSDDEELELQRAAEDKQNGQETDEEEGKNYNQGEMEQKTCRRRIPWSRRWRN